MSSFQTQYGIRLTREIKDMKWDEFKDLLVGISPDTPLGNIVSIRAENDKEILKRFSPEQLRIRNAWRARQAAQMEPRQIEDVLNALKNAFLSMSE